MLDTKTLIAVLKQEQTLRTRHCQVLEAQQRALLACDRTRFAALEPDHADLLVQLQEQEIARREVLMDDNGEPQTLSVLLEQMEENSRMARTLAALRDKLRETIERSQILMQRNEMLIRNELSYLAFSLDLFVEAGRTAGQSYGGGAVLGGRLGLDRRA